MGVYTAIMAVCVPDGNSFHDIAVTEEWWILPAILIIVNCKKPLEAALKTFVFFLISQPIVYLVQVPFSSMGWGLFMYYPYWFKITFLTLPGAFVGWYIKKDKWYSGIIISVMTALLVFEGVNRFNSFLETPPNHIITAIYCFAVAPLLIFAILKKKEPRIIASAITVAALVISIYFGSIEPYETYNNTFLRENEIVLVGEPQITMWSGEAEGGVEIIKYDEGYNFKISGYRGKKYYFDITDSKETYEFEYYYDENLQTVIIKKRQQ